jgi:hypothetical protein
LLTRDCNGLPDPYETSCLISWTATWPDFRAGVSACPEHFRLVLQGAWERGHPARLGCLTATPAAGRMPALPGRRRKSGRCRSGWLADFPKRGPVRDAHLDFLRSVCDRIGPL